MAGKRFYNIEEHAPKLSDRFYNTEVHDEKKWRTSDDGHRPAEERTHQTPVSNGHGVSPDELNQEIWTLLQRYGRK